MLETQEARNSSLPVTGKKQLLNTAPHTLCANLKGDQTYSSESHSAQTREARQTRRRIKPGAVIIEFDLIEVMLF
jgi:hypothetical protein